MGRFFRGANVKKAGKRLKETDDKSLYRHNVTK